MMLIPIRPVSDTVMNNDKIILEDDLVILSGSVPPSYRAIAKDHALHILSRSNLQVNTFCSNDDLDLHPDFEHLYAVIRRLLPKDWFLPKECLVFELANYGDPERYRYHVKQFKPVDMILRLEGRAKPYEWSLTPDIPSTYEDDLAMMNNIKNVGPEDRFTVFQYFHKLDIKREHMTKIFYKKDPEEYLRLHCVAIPLALLTLILLDDNNEDERRPSF